FAHRRVRAYRPCAASRRKIASSGSADFTRRAVTGLCDTIRPLCLPFLAVAQFRFDAWQEAGRNKPIKAGARNLLAEAIHDTAGQPFGGAEPSRDFANSQV